MPTRAELISIAEQAVKEGDDATAHEAMDMIDKLDAGSKSPEANNANVSDVPLVSGMQGYEEQQAAQQAQYANKPAEPSLMDKVKALPEVAGALITGATSGLIGQGAGFTQQLIKEVSSGQFGTNEAANRIAQNSSDVGASLTYSPKSEAGQQILSSIAQASEPLAAITPLAGEMGIISQATKVASPAIKAETVGALNKVADIVKSEAKILKPQQSATAIDTINKIKSGSTDSALAPVELKLVDSSKRDAQGNLLPSAYKVVDDAEAKKAITQGFDNGEVSLLKSANEKDASLMQEMVNISEKGKNDLGYMAENRPSDVLGRELLADYKQLQIKNRAAGTAIDNIAKKELRGQQVDVSVPVQDFLQKLTDDLGVKFETDANGKIKPKFGKSEIRSSGYKKEQQFLKNTIDDLVNSGMPDAYNVHTFKRAIDNIVYSGKTTGLNKTVENAVKGFRAGLDETLDNTFPAYNTANVDYAKTIRAMGDLQDAAGKKLDFNASGADKQLGVLTNRLLSNVQSRQQLTNAIDQLRATAKEYGRNSDYDASKLAMMSNILDRRFGTHAPRSLGGEVEKSGSGAISQLGEKAARGGLTVVDVGVAGAKAGYEKYKGINNENAYKSLRVLLAKQRRKAMEQQQLQEVAQ